MVSKEQVLQLSGELEPISTLGAVRNKKGRKFSKLHILFDILSVFGNHLKEKVSNLKKLEYSKYQKF